MAVLRGITVLDLLGLAAAEAVLPGDIRTQLDKLAIIDHSSTTSRGAFIHYGTVRSVADMGLPALKGWPVQAPGLNTGLPFQLTLTRSPIQTSGSGLEPSPRDWRLDLLLDRVSIVLPGLRPAKVVGSGLTSSHLAPDPSHTEVRIYGSGVFRVATIGGSVVARFIDQPDPFDPAAPTGAVFAFGFDPPSFTFGDSSYGLTIDRLTYDDSEEYTPPDIEARGHDAAWRGLSIKQATFYPPPNLPFVGDLSVGVRDVLLGTPAGMQGTVRLEFGATPIDATVIDFRQLVDGSYQSLGPPVAESEPGKYKVTFAPNTPDTAQILASFPSAYADWVLPDFTSILHSREAGPFTAREGDYVNVWGNETAQDGSPAIGPQVMYTLVHPGAGAPLHAPKIDVTFGAVTKSNVTEVSGTADALAGFSFAADPAPADPTQLNWQLDDGTGSSPAQGATYTLARPDWTGLQDLMLKDSQNHTRRVRIEVIDRGGLIVGCASGAFDSTGTAVPVMGVDSTNVLDSFHHNGELLSAVDAATIGAGVVTVAAGDIAQVSLLRGSAQDPDAPLTPPASEPIRHVQVEFVFNTPEEYAWGPLRPNSDNTASWDVAVLRQWGKAFVGATFVVVGRCCDIGTQSANIDLAQRRAQEGSRLLTGSVADTAETPISATVYARGERDTPVAAESGLGLNDHWLIKDDYTPDEIASWGSDQNRPERIPYRRADIYAVGGTYNPASGQDQSLDSKTKAPTARKTLIPGGDVTTPTLPSPKTPRTPYRVLLEVTWDSPTVVGWSDAIPTLAELTVTWQSHPVALPQDPGGSSVQIQKQGSTPPPTYTLKGHLSYDSRSGQTLFSLAFDDEASPDQGIGELYSNLLALALALGPPMAAAANASDVIGDAVRFGALVAACAVLEGYAKDGKTIVHGIKIEERQRSFTSLAGSRQRLLFDYSVSIGFDVDYSFIHVTSNKPLKVRYRGVGVELDNSKTGLDRFGFVFKDATFDIADAGQWAIQGPLGDLLRVVGSRAGSGSTWFEIDLRFALDLGVVTISGATVRISFDATGGVSVELSGLQAAVEIPDVLDGAGGLSMQGTGGLAANLDILVIPADIEAMASLVLNPPEVALEVGVLFSVGIPLANTGLGLFGFVGRFVANGARQLPPGPDPIQQEIDWYHATLAQKYTPQQGAWALGLGAVVGTLPDTAYTFNALGSFCIDFPNVSVVFGIDAQFISSPKLPSESGGDTPPTTGLSLLGLIAIDSTAVKVGIRGSYSIQRLLQLNVPVNGYFPLPGNPADPFVRIGADDVNGRTGPPVTLRFLPDSLNLQAWAYLMVEAHQLHALGGDNNINLDGFSIGFGAGFSLSYSAGPLRISVTAKLLVGVGTKPLMLLGEIEINGQLDLVVVTVSIDGSIHFKVKDDEQRLDGHFCGSVSFFFFSVSGCVDVSLGSDPGAAIPVPPSPLTGIDMTDRRAVITGTANANQAQAPTVWPDTVPVLHFAHHVRTSLAGSAFNPAYDIPGPDWSGTTELKYAYRVVGVEVIGPDGNPLPGPLDCAWWLPSHRSAFPGPHDPPISTMEGRDLGLFSWQPAAWARNLGPNGNQAPGDPANTISSLCEVPPTAGPVCAFGKDAIPDGPGAVVISPEEPSPPPFPSFFQVLGTTQLFDLDFAAIVAMAGEFGAYVVPGAIENLCGPFVSPSMGSIEAAYRLPYAAHQGELMFTLPFDGVLAPEVIDPELTLAVCLSTGGKTGTQQHCVDFNALKPGTNLGQDYVYQGLVFRTGSAVLQTVAIPGSQADVGLAVGESMLIRLPYAVGAASVDVISPDGEPILLVALNAQGAEVSRAMSAPGSQQATLNVAGAAIGELRITGRGMRTILAKVCFDAAPHVSAMLSMAATTFGTIGAGLPAVVGFMGTSANPVPWPGQIVGRAGGPDCECVFIRYRPRDSGPWSRFEIQMSRGREVSLVSCCGIEWSAAQAQDQNQLAQVAFTNFWNATAGSNTPVQHPILQPGTSYQIRVRTQYQGWRKSQGNDQPSPIDNTQWIDLPDDVNWFSTASEPATPPTTNVDYRDESIFDARATARYLIAFEPDGSGPPHFLDDPAEVHFSVDHLPQLLSLYNRSLAFLIRRTDPAPGTLPAGTPPPSVPHLASWKKQPKKYMAASDRRMLDAAQSSTCGLQQPNLGGATVQLNVNLEPNASYDLLVVAQPTADPTSDQILVARSHFKTSHYRNPGEMLAALGFSGPAPNAILPHDALVAAGTPIPAAEPPSDQAIDTALAALGLEPWPLPKEPRSVVIWESQGSGVWTLDGVMLETDEPLVRPGRLDVQGAAIAGSTFTTVRVNSAGTRIMLAASGPTLSGENTLTVTLVDPSGATVSGGRRVLNQPRLAYQEVT